MLVIRDRTAWLTLLGVVGIFGVYASIDWWRAREDKRFANGVILPLHNPYFQDKGFRVGDVTELYRLGKISRRLAEANTAPLRPLVPKPIPFHGYYVRAMELGPPNDDDQPPVSFKGQTWCKENVAILIYPVEHGPGKKTWMGAAGDLLFRSDDWTPAFQYPTPEERRHWGIID